MKKLISLLLCFSVLTATSGLCASGDDFSVDDTVNYMITCYKDNQLSGYGAIQDYLAQLKAEDRRLGSAWQEIMDYWQYINNDITVNPDVLPDGLPTDDSLCIVVLGYELNPDGSVTDELVGRCQTALDCAEKYPNSYVAVTGGGTALYNKKATEADSMAEWLVENGLDEDRLIIENQSQTTVENAQFTCKIISEEYPQIKELAIVSSEYHIPLGCLLFKAQLALDAYSANTREKVHVISNAGFMSGSATTITLVWQAADLRTLWATRDME